MANGDNDTSDLKRYIQARKSRDPEFAEGYEAGYEQFKIGVFLQNARERAGLTQEELARKMDTPKSAISRIEKRRTSISPPSSGTRPQSESGLTFPYDEGPTRRVALLAGVRGLA